MSLRNIISKLKKVVKFDVIENTKQIIESNSEYISNLLAIQLAQGRNGDGDPVFVIRKGSPRYDYAPFTVYTKQKWGTGLGKEVRWITNYFTGAFYSELYAESDGYTISIKSRVPYFDDIIARSGTRIMHLNEEHLKQFKDKILIPELKRRMNGI